MSEIHTVQAELIEDFRLFDNWIDRYQYIIDLGKDLPEFPDAWRNEENRIHGCQSQVWLKT
ncbi:MAG: SufE family protein, partial [Gammaproteobacteria bacterium]|nr:SufE family protein [Gammaproteobacteria bacterium]